MSNILYSTFMYKLDRLATVCSRDAVC